MAIEKFGYGRNDPCYFNCGTIEQVAVDGCGHTAVQLDMSVGHFI